jgi:peptidoglycan hydrolase-like protein with peptidoglycan-binding domain
MVLAMVLVWVTVVGFSPTSVASEVKVAIAKENVIIRSKPSSSSAGQKTVKAGGQMTVLDGGTSDWCHVQYGSIIGYVSKDYVSLRYIDASSSASSPVSSDASSVSSTEKISDLGDPPEPTREGDSGSNVSKLQKALKIAGFFSGTCDGKYGEYTVNAVKAFQRSRGLSEDGIAGAGTIKYLFGASPESSSKYKTEKLDWFDGGSSAIPKGARFTVKDVRTGVTFEASRWSGYNHLDVEPLTAKDSAAMKRVFGGSWSWARRPILVLYRGHVYAASMNGMPHEENITSGNGFDGHFCIHFYNSRTHGTDKVDTEHQACVYEASKATW